MVQEKGRRIWLHRGRNLLSHQDGSGNSLCGVTLAAPNTALLSQAWARGTASHWLQTPRPKSS